MSIGDEPAYPRDFYASAYSAGEGPLELTIPEPGPPGLTKRELFAAMAMQGFLANEEHPIGGAQNLAGWRAEASVVAADALIEELNK